MNDAFHLMIVGEFKRGKSTLINSLLGNDILPAKVAPCTAIITKVKYAEKPHAILHYSDAAKNPVTVAIEELRKYVVIDDNADDDDDPSASISRSPYESMELHYPLPLCKNNVQIVDSPGLNEHKTRSRVTEEFLFKSDALVMVLSCQQALSESELQFIDNQLGGRNLCNVFFVWNHYDAIADSTGDIDDLKKRSARFLKPRLGSDGRIFYLSAKTALLGKKRSDRAAVERSGIVSLENALERFLGRERGRVKLQGPLRVARESVREALTDVIPQSQAMLSQPLDKLQKAYDEQLPRLAALEQQRDRFLRSVERRRDALIRDATASYLRFVGDTEMSIRSEVATIDVGLWDSIKKSAAKKQIQSHIDEWFAKRVSNWQENDVSRIFNSHIRDLDEDIEAQSRDFLANIDSIRHALTPNVQGISFESDVSATNRILSAVGGLVVGGIGSAIAGAGMGYKGVLKGLGVNIVAIIGLAALGVGAPFMVPILAMIGIGQVVVGAKGAAEKLKEEMAVKFVDGLRLNAREATSRITMQITTEFANLYDALEASLGIRIDELSGQVQAILANKKKGEDHMRSELQRLAAARQSMARAYAELDSIGYEIEGLTSP